MGLNLTPFEVLELPRRRRGRRTGIALKQRGPAGRALAHSRLLRWAVAALIVGALAVAFLLACIDYGVGGVVGAG